jgi:GMP synthase-like glutamine amidotransferase
VGDVRRVLVINVNLSEDTLDGCRGIAEAITRLQPTIHPAIRHWEDIVTNGLDVASWDALVLGPNETPFPAYPSSFQVFLDRVRALDGPLLGICGGHQVLGLAYGATVGPVFDIPSPTVSYEGLPKVRGCIELRNIAPQEPLLDGLEETLVLDASHVEALENVPEGFRLLVTGSPCKVQVIGHATKHVFGVQCHPERLWDATDGRTLLRNFLSIVDATRSSA